MSAFLVLALAIAVGAAIRSTWSPCGWSMLSTLTPISERARGHRYVVTGLWFVLGATAGGLALGFAGAFGAALLTGIGISATAAGTLAVLGIAVALVVELGLVPRVGDVDLALPHHRRQVNELWLDELRPWVYATGFGAQIGFGLATYIMTTGVYLVILLSALVTPPWVAMLVGASFGFVRGMAVFASARCRTPAQLNAFHRRFESLTQPVRRAMIGLEAAVGATYAVLAWDGAGMVVVALAVTASVVWYRRRGPVVPQGVPSDESMAANQRPESLGTRRWVA